MSEPAGLKGLDLERVSHWVQLISGLVLIVGVVLVVVQLQQNERLSRTQIASDWFSQRAAQAGSAAGENPMHAYAKLCDPEAALTVEDATVLHALFLQRYFMGIHGRVVSQISGDDSSELWKQLLQSNMNLVVATEQGRAWFETLNMDEEARAAVEASPYFHGGCAEFYDREKPFGALLRTDEDVKARLRGGALNGAGSR